MKRSQLLKFVLYGVTFAYMGIIFFLSSQSSPPQPAPTTPYRDIIAHIIEYTFLGLLLSFSFYYPEGKENRKTILAILVAIVYGLTDEIHQFFVPRRYFTLLDLLADAFGAIVGGFSSMFAYDTSYSLKE